MRSRMDRGLVVGRCCTGGGQAPAARPGDVPRGPGTHRLARATVRVQGRGIANVAPLGEVRQYANAWSPPVRVNGTLYAVTGNGFLEAYDAVHPVRAPVPR